MLPSDVIYGGTKTYWWKCEKGHSYQASPSNRHKGRGCPYCSNRRVLVGYNDLATVYPDMILEWDYEKNIDVSPTEVTPHSGQKVYWKCSLGHSWKTSIRDRTTGGTNCPYCYKLKRGIKIE